MAYLFEGANIDPGPAGGFNPSPRRVMVLSADTGFSADALAALRVAGYSTTAMRDGHQASRLLHWFRPEVVILQVPLPGPEDWDPMAEIRTQAPGVPVVVIADDASLETQLRDQGATAFLLRPFELGDLVSVVARLLSRPPA
jgi:DNA-binding NtrC family response regulator